MRFDCPGMLMLRRHMSQEVVLAKERLANRTATPRHRTVKTLEAFHLWVHRLHMPYEVFVVSRTSVWAIWYNTFEVPAVRLGMSIEKVALFKGLQT